MQCQVLYIAYLVGPAHAHSYALHFTFRGTFTCDDKRSM